MVHGFTLSSIFCDSNSDYAQSTQRSMYSLVQKKNGGGYVYVISTLKGWGSADIEVHSDGKTSRNKALSPELNIHGPGTVSNGTIAPTDRSRIGSNGLAILLGE